MLTPEKDQKDQNIYLYKDHKDNKDNKYNKDNKDNKDRDDQYTALIRVLLIFYLVIANNFTENLFSKQLKTFFTGNRYAQHIIAFIMMLVLIMIIGGVKKIENGVFYSIIFYFWFIFTTKLDVQWNLIIILLLLFGFIYESKLNEKETQIESDETLTSEEKELLINSDRSRKFYILAVILGVTIIGSSIYINKQEVQYGGGFDLMRFLFF